MISAATPAAWGEAIDVPLMQPNRLPGSVETMFVVQSPVTPSPPGAAMSAQPLPQFEYDALPPVGPSAAVPATPETWAGTTLHFLPPGGLARFVSSLPSAEISVTPRCRA